MGQFSVLSEKKIVGNVNYQAIVTIIMMLLQGFIWNKQGALARKRTWGPPFLFQNLSSHNKNNQLAKFEKNLSVGSISVE